MAAQRIGSEERGRKPRVVTMTLPSHDAVRQVMRYKRNLKDSQAYSRVCIEPDRPQEIRALEAIVRQLARDNPSLQETLSALKHAKNGKAVGIDNIPNEIIKVPLL